MLAGHLEVARRYILYREQRRQARAEREGRGPIQAGHAAAAPAQPQPEEPLLPEGISAFTRLRSIYAQALPKPWLAKTTEAVGRRHFDCYLNEGDYLRCLSPRLLDFDYNCWPAACAGNGTLASRPPGWKRCTNITSCASTAAASKRRNTFG